MVFRPSVRARLRVCVLCVLLTRRSVVYLKSPPPRLLSLPGTKPVRGRLQTDGCDPESRVNELSTLGLDAGHVCYERRNQKYGKTNLSSDKISGVFTRKIILRILITETTSSVLNIDVCSRYYACVVDRKKNTFNLFLIHFLLVF